jgi:hypothetical protein
MATIKKPIKKAQAGKTVKDKTSVAKTRNVSKDLKFDKSAKSLAKDVKKVTRPYTAIATPDPEALFPGDSIRYYPGKRGGVGVPYIRDVGGKPGLLGIDTNTTDVGFAKASRDKKNFRTYQDTTAVKANFEKDKNGGKVVKKAKSGTTVAKAKDGKWMQKAAASIKRRGTEGKCTPITKPGCTGRAKALAKTFKKIAKSNKKK